MRRNPVNITVAVDEAMRDQLVELAKRDDRTLAQQLRWMLRAGLARRRGRITDRWRGVHKRARAAS